MERRVSRFRVGVADSANDSALARVGIPVLRRQGRECDARTIVRCWIEVRVDGSALQMGVRFKAYGLKRNVIDIVGGHVAARAEGIQQRSGTRQLIFFRPDIEGGRALVFIGKWIVAGLCCTVWWFRSIALAIGGSRARQRKKR